VRMTFLGQFTKFENYTGGASVYGAGD
jgi:hypothetical protein